MSADTAMVEAFNNQGYYVLRNVISPDLAHALYNCAVELQSRVVGRSIVVGSLHVADEWDAQNLGWDGQTLEHPTLQAFVRHPDFIRPMSLMAGGELDAEPADWAIHQTDPGDAGVLWHQDLAPVEMGATIAISVMMMETPATEPNYHVIPGSQDRPAPTEQQMVEMQPGEQVVAQSNRDVLVHSPLLWHSSIQNASARPHRRLLMYFKARVQDKTVA